MGDTEVAVTPELLDIVLASLKGGEVLVGGQALAFWAQRYEIPLDAFPRRAGGGAVVSLDADFLGSRSSVDSIATAVHGAKHLTPRRALSALVGQVTLSVSADEYVNFDILHQVVGIDADVVRQRAIEVELRGIKFAVMHPLDVLASRASNVKILESKRTEDGAAQLRLALQVARAFVAVTAQSKGDRAALKAVEYIVTIGKSGAGRYCQKHFGSDFCEAIPPGVITDPEFRARRYPQIIAELGNPKGTGLVPEALDVAQAKLGLSIAETNLEAGRYTGKIVWTDGRRALQSVGRKAAVLHDVTTWPFAPSVGQSVDVQYKAGQVAVKDRDAQQLRRSQKLGR